jgi:hypothetical protein
MRLVGFAGTRGHRYGNRSTSAKSIYKPSFKTQATSIYDIGRPGANATVIKARIIEHKNADQSDSLEDYLKFYNSINAASQSAKLIEFDL